MSKSSRKELEELKTKVALGNRIMFHQGLADYHGHVSARIPGTRKFFIKPVLAPLGEISSKDIILVDIDEYMEVCEENYAKAGNQRAITKLKNPPRETMIHAAIYAARADVNSVVHTHQSLATAFSVAGTPILPIYNQAAVFAPETPIFPSPRLIYTIQDGKEICQTLGDRMAMLLKGHGVIVCGDSLEYATVHAIYLERTAYMQFVASCVGKPAIMPQPDIDYMKENMKYRAYDGFAYFKSLLPKKGRL
ncbi:MAG TPA: class II aldolase/adducin family protein [Candidatus Binatia bacterium]|jgi:L-ribulose-5-phosphate 4-epimerase|nr:class II aldolase/adducin family protein [Candidatus Binatia bacterium]